MSRAVMAMPRRNWKTPPAGHLLLLATAIWLAGCQSDSRDRAALPPADYQPLNFSGVLAMPADVRRVAVLPIAPDVPEKEDVLGALDGILRAELIRTRRFECSPISRDDCHQLSGNRCMRSSDVLPPDFLQRLAARTGADAVLFIDLTHHSAYKPLSIGFRARLVRLDDRSCLWSFDELFSSIQPWVAAATRSDCRDGARSAGVSGSLPDTPLESPSRFAVFTAGTMFATLPLRYQ